MSITGLPVFDKTVHTTNTWLHEITSRLGWDNRKKGYRALQASLHALRDQMPLAEVAKFSAQLPVLLRGVFFEGWRPLAKPNKARSKDEFLARIQGAFPKERDFDAEATFCEVITVIKRHISAGEIEGMRRTMPKEIKDLLGEDFPG